MLLRQYLQRTNAFLLSTTKRRNGTKFFLRSFAAEATGKGIVIDQNLKPEFNITTTISWDPRKLFATEWADDNVRGRIRSMQKYHKIAPDVLERPFLPITNFSVSFGEELAQRGNILSPKITIDKPTIKYDGNKIFTLIMTDPDSPAYYYPSQKEFLHWLVVNIPGNEIEKGNTVVDYIGAIPAQNSGKHRYIILLLEQKEGNLQFAGQMIPSTSIQGRPGFKTAEFIKKNALKPCGISFFQAEWDDGVTEIYKKAGVKQVVLVRESIEAIKREKNWDPDI